MERMTSTRSRNYCAGNPDWFTPLRKPAGVAACRTLNGSAVYSPIDGSGTNSQFIAGIDAIRWHRSALVPCIHRDTLCDPAVGSGSLLLQFAKVLGKENVRQ